MWGVRAVNHLSRAPRAFIQRPAAALLARSASSSPFSVTASVADRQTEFQVGKVAKLADGAVVARAGDSVVLITVVSSRSVVEGKDFMPLSVDYREKFYAAGKIPGTWGRREVNQSDDEILKSRIIDRSIRPLFPEGYFSETQVLATVQAYDGKNDPVVAAVNAASAALMVSDIPWDGPIGCVRVGKIDNKLILNPTPAELEESTIDIVYAANEKRTLMIEAAAEVVSKEELEEALLFAHDNVRPLIESQLELARHAGSAKRQVPDTMPSKEMMDRALAFGYERAKNRFNGAETKKERAAADAAVMEAVKSQLKSEFPGKPTIQYQIAGEKLLSEATRDLLLEEGCVRGDGRSEYDIRSLSAEVSVLPQNVHGSSLFSRGDTQALCTVTMGPPDQAQVLRSVTSLKRLKYAMLHYEFPPYCVNEVGKVGGVNRRMIGHGALAEKAVIPVLPTFEEFPYTVRITSEITGSDGSSSMASCCGASLALMDAGVPITAPVAGISVGLVTEVDGTGDVKRYKLLTDILGSEDHFGDMDFKVAGTREGITAIQLDVKLAGVPLEILLEGITRATEARMKILDRMSEEIRAPRSEFKPTVPCYQKIELKKPGQASRLIGPKGATVQSLEALFGANLTVEDDTVVIYAPDAETMKKIEAKVKEIIRVPEVGAKYKGVVTKVLDYGAVLEILPGTEGLLHISEMLDVAPNTRVTQIVKEGDNIDVICIEEGQDGKGLRLSMRPHGHTKEGAPARQLKHAPRSPSHPTASTARSPRPSGSTTTTTSQPSTASGSNKNSGPGSTRPPRRTTPQKKEP